MKQLLFQIINISIALTLLSSTTSGQDDELPLPPVLDLVTVDPAIGHATLYWSPGGSSDVAGYIIYLYINNEGLAVDTIYIPEATDYTHTESNAGSFSVNYVIAAIDSSGNTSPLSNPLNTIFTTTSLDTCNHKIDVVWNSYNNEPFAVDYYRILYSIDGSPGNLAGTTAFDDTVFYLNEFEISREYCFTVEAVLSNGSVSVSNMSCIYTNIKKPPDWINADYATVNSNGKVELSFTYDQDSETDRFRLERSENPLTGFTSISEITDNSGNISIVDDIIPDRQLFYRLSALNTCLQPVKTSNNASVIFTQAVINGDKAEIIWTPLTGWLGGVDEYVLFRVTNNQVEEVARINNADTSYIDDLYSFIYMLENEEICYYITAYEGINSYYTGAVSQSNLACIEMPVRVFTPNAFTPDGDLINDTFRPILSFTPKSYRLIIKNRTGITLFETTNHHSEWDGTFRGVKLQEDAYLWFLELVTPGGKSIIRSGTITLLF